ncbi:unnamed protein product [Trifolium pratense]|uniref:Uncharacterized protein n=1 Tax=Trifolium pratense TaxID=57577 RepID=A0ACB0IUA4_TRIPR|nr:unnamed protein product [Trifolium pratense]
MRVEYHNNGGVGGILRDHPQLSDQVMMILLMKQIMTPTLIGDLGSHYVCFVVNLKSQTFQFLNSLSGEKLHFKNEELIVYKKMFDVKAFVFESQCLPR